MLDETTGAPRMDPYEDPEARCEECQSELVEWNPDEPLKCPLCEAHQALKAEREAHAETRRLIGALTYEVDQYEDREEPIGVLWGNVHSALKELNDHVDSLEQGEVLG